MSVLTEIIAYKRDFVAICKQKTSIEQLREAAIQATPPRGFIAALIANIELHNQALIAELKKASPSKGLIRADFSPANLALAYQQGGATCLSVLTDERYFQGSDEYLRQVLVACDLPVLRKDFMIDTYQIVESRAIGADCILLIMAALSDAQAMELEALAHQLRMDVLVEVHDETELERALKHLSTKLIGINNRNLKTMQVDLQTSINLRRHIPEDYIVVCESGIKTNTQLRLMQARGIKCFLVGESLMLCDDVAQATRELLA